mmetsp:Transcript_15829/g.17143  ORF Transcript_15829/g.17143 Transcript_15829/m.17143 type:complete len:351 (+) Transcript_15829:126-1178(+)
MENSPYQRSTSDGIGINDEILQSNGISVPVLMDLSSFEFEFFSDDEDNCVVVDQTMFPTIVSQYEGEGKKVVEESMIKVSRPGTPTSSDTVSIQASKQTVQPTSTILSEAKSMIETDSSTQTLSNPLIDQSTNTANITHEDSAVQTEPLSFLSQELENIHLQKEEDIIQKIEGAVDLPPPPTAPSLKAEVEKKEDSPPPSPVRPKTLNDGNSGHQYHYVMDPANMKISFMEFAVGDIALFVPVDEKKERWMAFHSNRPHRYLAQESLDSFLSKDRNRVKPKTPTTAALTSSNILNNQSGKERSRILGRIVLIDTHVTSGEFNPYQLPIGTVFYICYVEPLLVPKKKSSHH